MYTSYLSVQMIHMKGTGITIHGEHGLDPVKGFSTWIGPELET